MVVWCRYLLAVTLPLTIVGACTYDWEQFDPRIDDGSGAAAGAPIGGGGNTAGGGEGGGSAGTGGSAGSGGAAGGAGGGVLGPWSPPEIVAALSDPDDDDDPTFTADVLELYFNSGRGAGPSKIWKSTRANRNDPWGTPEEAVELNSSSGETNPAIASDGLTIWFSSARAGGTLQDIHVSTRPDRGTAWAAPVIVPELNSSEYDMVSSVSSDGLTIYIYSDRGGTVDEQYVSTRASTTDAWGTPVLIASLNSGTGDSQAWLGPQGLIVYFDSLRNGTDRDIYMATRALVTDAWSTPVPVTELNTAEADSDAWLSPDQRYLMMTRGSAGAREIYEAFR